MLKMWRRHVPPCAHKASSYLKCKCPLWVMGTLNGKFIRRSLDTRSLERAGILIHAIEMGKEQVRLDKAVDRFLDDMRSRSLSDETIKKSERLLESLKDKVQGFSVGQITSDDLARFREGWKAKPITSRKMLERLRSFFNFCIDRGWIERNPAKILRPPKEVAVEVKPYEKWELEKIEWGTELFPDKGIYGAQNRERLKAFIAVLRWTGLRIRDVVQLRRSQVQSDFIILRTHKNQKPVKLLMHDEVKDALKRMENGEFYFWSGLGNPKSCVGDWQRSLRRLSEASGVHIHAHRWRHTFATDLLSKGVPISEVAAILGNSPAIVEKHYSQWVSAREERLNEAIKKTW